MSHKLAFIHTSPAAIAPLMQFYGAAGMEITNLLDDGLLRLLRLLKSILSILDTQLPKAKLPYQAHI